MQKWTYQLIRIYVNARQYYACHNKIHLYAHTHIHTHMHITIQVYTAIHNKTDQHANINAMSQRPIFCSSHQLRENDEDKLEEVTHTHFSYKELNMKIRKHEKIRNRC